MLAENWVPAEREEQAEEDPDAPPPAAFDPTSAEYHVSGREHKAA